MALDTTGALLPWNPDSNGTVNALAAHGSTIYAGGDFGTIGGLAMRYFAPIDAATGLAK